MSRESVISTLKDFAEDYRTYIPQFHARNRKRMKLIATDLDKALDEIERVYCKLDELVAADTDDSARMDALDAARYRWLRDPETNVGLVIDKRVGLRRGLNDEFEGYDYEYRAGDELDAAIDAARERGDG